MYLQTVVLNPLKFDDAATVYEPKFSTYTISLIANSGNIISSAIKSILSQVGPKSRLLYNFPSRSLNGKIVGVLWSK